MHPAVHEFHAHVGVNTCSASHKFRSLNRKSAPMGDKARQMWRFFRQLFTYQANTC